MSELLGTLDRETYRAILDTVGEGVYVLDGGGRIVYWNRACETLTGYTREEAIGSRCSHELLRHVDVEGNELCSAGCPMAATLQDGEPREAEIFLHHSQGHRVPVRVHIRPVRATSGEVVAAVQSFTDIADKVAALEQAKELEGLAYLDHLTGTANRRFLERAMEARLDESERYGWTLGLIMLDIDFFKTVNDTYGHEAGDQTLRMVARTLENATRSFDLIGRWGGEEFLVIVPNTTPSELGRIAERYRALVEKSDISVDGQRLTVTVSLGAALADTSRDSSSSLLGRADRLLYQSKRNGRNQVTVDAAGARPVFAGVT